MFPVLGVVAGILAGLLGIGGGLVLVAALAWILPLHGIPKEAAMHAALASSLASIILTASSSAYAHHRRGSVLWPTVAWMVPGLLLGGWLGSGLAAHLDDRVLRWIVAGYCFIAGAQMVFGGRAHPEGRGVAAPRGMGISAAGSVIGAVSAVVGIGGGSMTVPLLVWRGVQPVRAVGTSSACGVAIGIASSIALTLIAWSMDLVHPYFYLAISILLCIVIGYLASLLFPAPTRNLDGLTIYARSDSNYVKPVVATG